jgi:hypothetical protein
VNACKSLFGAFAFAALLSGCGSQVIPGLVVEGTTATIAIPADFDVGYGRAWAGTNDETEPAFAPTSLVEDLQRGELIFRLYEVGQSVPGTKLAVRYITRVMRDASTSFATGTYPHSQPVAFLDIPYGLVDDGAEKAYEIKVQRFRRDPTATPAFKYVLVTQSYFTTDWWGWGSNDGGAGSQFQRIPIKVMDSPDDTGSVIPSTNRYTPIDAWGPYPARGTSGQIRKGIATQGILDYSVPRPEFRIAAAPNTGPRAAWDMQLTYPADRMQVLDVRILRENPSGAVAVWKASPTSPPGCGSPMSGTLDLHVADLQGSNGVAVVFGLANQTATACQQRIQSNDIAIVPNSYRGYDINGNQVAGASPYQILAYDFQ